MLGHVGIARHDAASTLLTLVFVRHGARGTGVASALLDAVAAEVERVGLPRRTVLYVHSGNAAAKTLYAARGFVDTGVRVRREDGVGSSEMWAAEDGCLPCSRPRSHSITVTCAPPSGSAIARWILEDPAIDGSKRNMNLRGATEAELVRELDAYAASLGDVRSLWAAAS